MSLWVLDTDALTFWLRGRESIALRIAATPPQQLAVTIITVEEALGGCGIPKSGKRAMISSLHEPIRHFMKPSSSFEAFGSYRSTFQRFTVIVNYGHNTAVSVRMISASRQSSSNSKQSW